MLVVVVLIVVLLVLVLVLRRSSAAPGCSPVFGESGPEAGAVSSALGGEHCGLTPGAAWSKHKISQGVVRMFQGRGNWNMRILHVEPPDTLARRLSFAVTLHGTHVRQRGAVSHTSWRESAGSGRDRFTARSTTQGDP